MLSALKRRSFVYLKTGEVLEDAFRNENYIFSGAYTGEGKPSLFRRNSIVCMKNTEAFFVNT